MVVKRSSNSAIWIAKMSDKLVQLTSCAKSNGLATELASDYSRMIPIWSNAFGSDALHIDLFDQLREDPQTLHVNGVLRHIGATTPWCPAKFINTKVHATSSLVGYKRQFRMWSNGILQIGCWNIRTLNDLLEGRLSSWVDDMRSIRGKARLSWRLLRELNLAVLSIPKN